MENELEVLKWQGLVVLLRHLPQEFHPFQNSWPDPEVRIVYSSRPEAWLSTTASLFNVCALLSAGNESLSHSGEIDLLSYFLFTRLDGIQKKTSVHLKTSLPTFTFRDSGTSMATLLVIWLASLDT